MTQQKKLKELGAELLEGRKTKKLSLANTASPAKISPTYLQKLERGEINNPSPRVLKRVAEVLDLSYLSLMKHADYLPHEYEKEKKKLNKNASNRHSFVETLTDSEWNAVLAFVKYLRQM